MEDGFRIFLKKGGRSESAIKRALAYLREFEVFLNEDRDWDLQTAGEEDLEAFVAHIEAEPKTSAKGHLWGLIYYFDFTNKEGLKFLAKILREQRIERRPFPIRKFRGLDPGVVNKLEGEGIKHVNHILKAGATPQERKELADRVGVPEES